MFLCPYTHSLGPAPKFSALAASARRNKKEWRKVARMIQKYNVLSNTREDGKMIRPNPAHVGPNYNKRNVYLCRACLNTNLAPETIQEIYRIFNLTSFASRVSLLS